jgi:hypothetical protein
VRGDAAGRHFDKPGTQRDGVLGDPDPDTVDVVGDPDAHPDR